MDSAKLLQSISGGVRDGVHLFVYIGMCVCVCVCVCVCGCVCVCVCLAPFGVCESCSECETTGVKMREKETAGKWENER